MWNFSYLLCHVNGCRYLFRQPCCLWVRFPCHVLVALFQSRCSGPLALSIFLTPFCFFPLNLCRTCIADISVGTGKATIIYSLEMWIPEIVSICCKKKKKAFSRGVGATLTSGYRDKYSSVVILYWSSSMKGNWFSAWV